MNDWREIMGEHAGLAGLGKHIQYTQKPPVKPSFWDIGHKDQAPSAQAPRPAPAVVEATFRPTVELVWPQVREKVTPVNPEFPACPECNSARYWITPSGKVVCGKCGEVRFLLTSITYHAIN